MENSKFWENYPRKFEEKYKIGKFKDLEEIFTKIWTKKEEKMKNFGLNSEKIERNF